MLDQTSPTPLTPAPEPVPAAAAPRPAIPPVVGESYEFHALRVNLGGENQPPHFVLHRGETILGLCLGLKWHPLAEADAGEVWVGLKGDLKKWGTRLAETAGPLPLFVRREEGGNWTFVGYREVAGSTVEVPEIKKRLQPPLITAICRIVFLRPASAPEPVRPAEAGVEAPVVESGIQ